MSSIAHLADSISASNTAAIHTISPTNGRESDRVDSVNSEPRRQLTVRLSQQGLAILRRLKAAPAAYRSDGRDRYAMAAGELPVNDLVRSLRRRGTSLAVTRASLSRTLRRLWRAGLVELATRYSYMPTMTEKQQRDRARIDADITDPVAAYERYKSIVGPEFDTCGSPEAYLAGLRANWGRAPDVRVQRVRITDAGRAARRL